MTDHYRFVGPIYDTLSHFYGGQSLQHCKLAMLDHLQPGDKVLFAGVGHGLDAIYAAQRGAEVTVVDLSRTMLNKFQDNLDSNAIQQPIRQLHSDIFNVKEYEQYDMVVANFFLNVFDQRTMPRVLAHLISLGKPQARVVVGDFSPARGRLLSRLLKALYWYPAILFFCLLTNNSLHRIYYYPDILRRLGLQVVEKRHFGIGSLSGYWSILAQKEGSPDRPSFSEVRLQ